MKRIQLQSIADARFMPNTPEYQANLLDWSEAIRQVLRRPLDPQKGADIEEMRRSIHVLDALDAADGTLELEDADWQHLCQKVRAMQWAFVDRRIVQLIDSVLDA
jgi:hypothetical protein